MWRVERYVLLNLSKGEKPRKERRYLCPKYIDQPVYELCEEIGA
jgi:hypothetical protein